MSVGKKKRFEVFKRDSFSCQYCGQSAPTVLLHVDHIKPVSSGGTDDILNLITSCQACNLGKGARHLSDHAVVTKQIDHMKELQDRQEQLTMLMQWRESLQAMQPQIESGIGSHFTELTGYHLHKDELKKLGRKAKKLGLPFVLECIESCCAKYLEYGDDGDATISSVNLTTKMIFGYIRTEEKKEVDPAFGTVKYVNGILRNKLRWHDQPYAETLIRNALNLGADAEHLKRIAAQTTGWMRWQEAMHELIEDLEE